MSTSPDEEAVHITAQAWLPELREDGVYLIGADDRTVVLKLCRPDRGSDLLIAGYIAGLQVQKLQRKETP
jgi:Ser/Thr protein kinase RdoA (MazF antagonist)